MSTSVKQDYESRTLVELRFLCKERGIRKYHKLVKKDLIELLREKEEESVPGAVLDSPEIIRGDCCGCFFKDLKKLTEN